MIREKKKVEDALLNLLLARDFNKIKIIDVQKKSGISAKKFFSLFKTKEEIMISFFKRIDKLLEKKIKKINFSSNLKDNLFETCMARLDLLFPYKKNLENFYLSFQKHPNLFIKLYRSFFESMEVNLKLSKIYLEPIKKNIKILIFSLLYLSIIYEWMKQETDNNDKIMAVLDNRLSLIENYLM